VFEIVKNQPLRTFNTLAIAVNAEYFCRVTSLSELQEAINYSQQHTLPITVLGGGSNLVLATDLAGLVVHMQITGISLDSTNDGGLETDRLVNVGAGENWHKLVEKTLANHWFGLENLALIPGLAGAAPIQNIGAYGVELKDVFASLEAVNLHTGEVVIMNAHDCQFGYRDSIFKNQYQDQFAIAQIQLKLSAEANLELSYPSLNSAIQQALERVDPASSQVLTPQLVAQKVCEIRRSKLPDPAVLPNAGSFFKNPVVSAEKAASIRNEYPGLVSYLQPDGTEKLAAGWLIDQCGWKGRQQGGVGVHSEQALVLVNQGGSGEDVLALAKEMSASVKASYGVKLEIEPRVYR